MDLEKQARELRDLGDPDLEIGPLRLWLSGGPGTELTDGYDDAGWLYVVAHCAHGGASVAVDGPILHLRELALFLSACEDLDRTLGGKAELGGIEPNLNVSLAAAGTRGTVAAEIRMTPDPVAQRHTFRLGLDESYLRGIIGALRKVLARYPARGPAH